MAKQKNDAEDRAHFRCFEVPKWVAKYYNRHLSSGERIITVMIIVLFALLLLAGTVVIFKAHGLFPVDDTFREWLLYCIPSAVGLVSGAFSMRQFWKYTIGRKRKAAQAYVKLELGKLLGIVQPESVNMANVEKGLAHLAHLLYACQYPGYAAADTITMGITTQIHIVPSAFRGLFGYARALARLAFTWEKVRLPGGGPDELVDPLDKEVLRKTYPLETLAQREYEL